MARTSHIALALSGGVDSLLAAYLLKQQGVKVSGIHFITGFEDPSIADASDAAQIHQTPIFKLSQQLGIDLHLLDCREPFKCCVVDYFINTYQAGQTPNPCLVCNPHIKFGTVLQFARQLGATHLATGHYARVHQTNDGRWHLYRGMDPLKDQSYFLSFLSQRQLSQALFPLGHMTKKKVKTLAAQKGLRPIVKAESQDICFIRGRSYVDFLMSGSGFHPEPGLIEDVQGRIIGEHDGLHRFTIGQRRGINCPAPHPYYVIRLDVKRNRLVVGSQEELQVAEFRVSALNWIIEPPQTPLEVSVRVRYRHAAVEAILYPQPDSCQVRFHRPQQAVTPGQGAVFYIDNEVLGGGIIDPA
jgi:tRNA-specific 2-thiouridylase